MKILMTTILGALAFGATASVALAQSGEAQDRRPIFSHRHFGIPIYGPPCRSSRASPYCDYSHYKGPIFVDGKWAYGGRFPHRYWHGRHQFWYQGTWRDGAWGHGGHWGGQGGYHSSF